jgi:hypothetical protein
MPTEPLRPSRIAVIAMGTLPCAPMDRSCRSFPAATDTPPRACHNKLRNFPMKAADTA